MSIYENIFFLSDLPENFIADVRSKLYLMSSVMWNTIKKWVDYILMLDA